MMNKTKVIKIQCPFERIKKYNSTPEAALYKAVIMQMIIDASNLSTDSKACRNAKKAKVWLFTSNDDFRAVCAMAGINPRVVITFAKTLIAIHCEKARVRQEVRSVGSKPQLNNPITNCLVHSKFITEGILPRRFASFE